MNRLALAALPRLFKWSSIAVMRTCKVRSAGLEHMHALRASGQVWLICAWHDNITMALYRLRGQGLAMMASASRDGELISHAIERFGNEPVRGSSSARGSQAARDMARALRRGGNGAMTPDGPRGPARQCQTGAVWIAVLTGCALVPYHLEAERQWRFRSWDRHKVPGFFTTIHEHYGEPLYVARGGEDTSLQELQARMLANTRACLKAAGHGEGTADLA